MAVERTLLEYVMTYLECPQLIFRNLWCHTETMLPTGIAVMLYAYTLALVLLTFNSDLN